MYQIQRIINSYYYGLHAKINEMFFLHLFNRSSVMAQKMFVNKKRYRPISAYIDDDSDNSYY